VKETILAIVKIGLPLTVTVSMFAQGLTIALSHMVLFRQQPVLMLRSLAVVLFLVPLAVVVILILLKPSPAVTIGLSILAACPAAPLMLIKIPGKGGSLAYMAVLHLSLALLALLTVPLTLDLFSRVLGFHAEVGVLAVARVAGMTILLPVCLGIVVRTLFPHVSGAIGPALARICKAALMALILCVVALTYDLLLRMNPRSYLVMAMVVVISIGIGHALGPRDPQERTTLAIESAARHPGLALTIASLNFSPDKALPVLVPYMVVFMVFTTIYLRWRKQHIPGQAHTGQPQKGRNAGGNGSTTGIENRVKGRQAGMPVRRNPNKEE
jgi:BASS family bile acid:Na+ symporter